MKKLLSLLLALLLIFSMAACTSTGYYEEDYLIYGPDYESFEGPEPIEVTEEISSDPIEESEPSTQPPTDPPTEPPIEEGGEFYSADDVALYLHTYGCLPRNYITKGEARGYGWTGGSVETYVPGAAIGGDRFYNREGLLPEADGREYYECDIDTKGRSSRGAERIVYSNDGLIYYTNDHYASFVLLYGEE